MKRLLGGVLAVFMFWPMAAVYAADSWYDVEFIIFAQRQPDGGNESWPEQLLINDWDTALPLPDTALSPVADAKLLPLPPEQYRLLGEVQRVVGDGKYELLLHSGWRQPGLAKEQSVAVRIRQPEPAGSIVSGDAAAVADASEPQPLPLTLTPPRLDGTLRLVLSRYLHLESDLSYRQKMVKTESLPEYQPALVVPTYRLRETRRMRSKELHYLDHPMFGVIALVTPYEPPPPAPVIAPPRATPATPPASTTGGAIRRN